MVFRSVARELTAVCAPTPTPATAPGTPATLCDTTGVIYSVTCSKQTRMCAHLRGPQYIACTSRPAKTRFSEHLISATQQCQMNTQEPVEVHFRETGHSHSDLVVLSIERVHTRDQFVLEARESYWIKQYKSVKNKPVNKIEHGLNLIS
jgi:hypothetical protein